MKELKENKIEKQNPIIKIIINKINSNKKMDQIWKKIKLKGCYKHLEGQTWKTRRREEKLEKIK